MPSLLGGVLDTPWPGSLFQCPQDKLHRNSKCASASRTSEASLRMPVLGRPSSTQHPLFQYQPRKLIPCLRWKCKWRVTSSEKTDRNEVRIYVPVCMCVFVSITVLFLKIKDLFLCICLCLHMWLQGPEILEMGVRAHGTGITDICEL